MARPGMAGMTTIEDLNALAPDAVRAALAGPPHQAAAFLRDAARAGVVEAQFQLGRMLLDGHDMGPAPAEGLHWFAEAARRGHVSAMNMVGRCYEHGWGIAADPERAAAWYRAAADRGLDWGMYNLATLLALGNGANQDRDAALALFRRAAALGHAKSINMIGSFLEDGWVVERDIGAAADHYRRAAEAGDFRGQFNHARMLIDAGEADAATRWLRRLPDSATPAFLDKVRLWLKARPEAMLRRVAAEL